MQGLMTRRVAAWSKVSCRGVAFMIGRVLFTSTFASS
jgi:hypothetical protein